MCVNLFPFLDDDSMLWWANVLIFRELGCLHLVWPAWEYCRFWTNRENSKRILTSDTSKSRWNGLRLSSPSYILLFHDLPSE